MKRCVIIKVWKQQTSIFCNWTNVYHIASLVKINQEVRFMICKRCGKEFFEDWRKEKTAKKFPCLYCSIECSHSRIQKKETKEKIADKLRKKERKFCSCGKLLHSRNKTGFCIDCKPKREYKSTAEIARKYRTKRKNILIENKGGKCEVCGYNKCIRALEFHHIDPNKKEYNVSTSTNIDIDILLEEIKKCILVCSNCHREIHSGVITIC